MINRLVVFCIIILSAINMTNGMLIQSMADVCAAYAFQCESCDKAKPFFVIAALANVYKMRFLAMLGFLLAATGRLDIAQKLLALHYSLIGIDDDSLAPVGRLVAGVAGVSLAL
jgi:hypothetical protein